MLALAILGGCSDDEPGADPPPAKGVSRQVGEVVERLEAASRLRDFGTICEDLLSADARERAGGADCEGLVRSTAGDVRRPEIEVLSIRISGDRADARVRSTAEGQDPIEDTIRLVREDGGYRIAALGG